MSPTSASSLALHHLGCDPARHQPDDVDAAFFQILGDDGSEAVERSLRAEIARHFQVLFADLADMARLLEQAEYLAAARSDVDDPPAAAPLHDRHAQLHQRERSVDIDVELVEPFLAAEVEEGLVPIIPGGGGGVVDEDIHAAETLDRLVDQPSEIRFAGEIGRNRDAFAAHLLDLRERLAERAGLSRVRARIESARGEHQLHTAPGQRQRRILADASARSGHDRDLAREVCLPLTLHSTLLSPRLARRESKTRPTASPSSGQRAPGLPAPGPAGLRRALPTRCGSAAASGRPARPCRRTGAGRRRSFRSGRRSSRRAAAPPG